MLIAPFGFISETGPKNSHVKPENIRNSEQRITHTSIIYNIILLVIGSEDFSLNRVPKILMPTKSSYNHMPFIVLLAFDLISFLSDFFPAST
jgi:hypothetical protein